MEILPASYKPGPDRISGLLRVARRSQKDAAQEGVSKQ